MCASRVLFAGPEFPAARPHLTAALPDVLISELDRRGGDRSAEVLVPLMTRVDGALLDSVGDLRLVQQWGAGLEGVDLAAASERGIAVGNVSSVEPGSADSVAEWCVMAALALSRRLPSLGDGIRAASGWGGPIGRSLAGKTAAIIGLGGIGSALARRLAAFSMDLVAVTARPELRTPADLGLRAIVGREGLEQVIEACDYVFLCLPLTSETRGLIGARELSLMRPDACLVNAGRGALIDEGALVEVLETGRPLGVALDVFWQEPLVPDHPLLVHPSVIATPHIAGITDTSYAAIARRVAEIVSRLESQLPLEHCVNWEAVAARFYPAGG